MQGLAGLCLTLTSARSSASPVSAAAARAGRSMMSLSSASTRPTLRLVRDSSAMVSALSISAVHSRQMLRVDDWVDVSRCQACHITAMIAVPSPSVMQSLQ